MPLVPNLLERTIFLTLNQGPAPLLDMFGAIGFRVAVAGIRLGVFEALDGSSCTRQELAKKLGTDPEGTRLLIEALAALGYVAKQGEIYSNTPMTRKWLVNSSETNFAPFLLYWETLLTEFMPNLEESIRTGKTPRNLYQWIENQPETSAYFQQAMSTMARFGGDEIINPLKLPEGPTRLLDVGGGHAMFSIAMCQKHPQLSATVLDSHEALESARANVKAINMSSRIMLQEGDFLKADYSTGYDMAFVFNIVHGLTPELNKALLGKIAAALKPSGQVVILEQLSGNVPSRFGKAVTRLLGLSYFHLIDGKTYSFEDVSGWLQATGFGNPRKRGLLKAPGNYVVTGDKLG